MYTHAELCAEIGVALGKTCEEPESELRVGVLVSHLIDPSSAVDDIQSKLDTFLNGVPLEGDAENLLVWFKEAGFADNSVATVTASHSSLAFLIDGQCGIPISHALLLIAAARKMGLTSFGVNFPGHFLVAVGDEIVDPLSYSVIEPAKLDRKFDFHLPATPQMIGLRMLNNLKALSLRDGEVAQALDIVDVQMAIADDAESKSSLYYERGEFWLRLGAAAAAKEAFTLCAEICPYPELSERARTQAASIDLGKQIFH
ncbi:MAG: hypothetical protein GKR90_02810 [Pseudomonadales bacterium]|nr:hypothetical protein [Pseudomonadales bacterium]